MKPYHKIQSVFKRDPATNHRTFTDEYSLPEFEMLKDLRWWWDEKIDGTNIRVHWDGNRAVTFGGRTDRADIPPFLLERLTQMFQAEDLRRVFENTEATLYGEGFGNKIQKVGKRYIPDGVDFILFDVKIGKFWLEKGDVFDIANQLEIRWTPTIGHGTIEEAVDFVRGGFKSHIADVPAEGLILRPPRGLLARDGSRIITKLKTRDFNVG